jgi:hypothetical protein
MQTHLITLSSDVSDRAILADLIAAAFLRRTVVGARGVDALAVAVAEGRRGGGDGRGVCGDCGCEGEGEEVEEEEGGGVHFGLFWLRGGWMGFVVWRLGIEV